MALIDVGLALSRRQSRRRHEFQSAARLYQTSELIGTVNTRYVPRQCCFLGVALVRQFPEHDIRFAGTHGTVDVPVEHAGSATGHRKSVEYFRRQFVLALPAHVSVRVASRTRLDDVQLVGRVDVLVATADHGSLKAIGYAGSAGSMSIVAAAVAVRKARAIAKAVSRVERK